MASKKAIIKSTGYIISNPEHARVNDNVQLLRITITNVETKIDFGYQAYIPFSLGAEYFRSRVDDGKAIKDRNTVWLKSTYNFGGTIPVLNHGYAGLALGAVFNSDKTSAAIAGLGDWNDDRPM